MEECPVSEARPQEAEIGRLSLNVAWKTKKAWSFNNPTTPTKDTSKGFHTTYPVLGGGVLAKRPRTCGQISLDFLTKPISTSSALEP